MTDWTARLETFARHCRTLPPAALAAEAHRLRCGLDAAGLRPAAAVARALEAALARGEGGPLIHGWIALLAEAAASGRTDRHAQDAFAAACSVRLAG
ncbi:hypothetical protein [Sphingomonas aracearum]|uniref:Uncharacterized protein n=1 Tax=Sphingomonas aracearum TaxID=2283317 RepID=A0A369VTG5_9SPHN|nr:hypothetical protein [Sphingomonas aracearum]RDE04837.1 hypothetical protein DVW87_14800 [Sphingomonas aracearum]